MENQNQVFIPSRGRHLGARKLTDAWHSEGFDVTWVVEPSEHDQYFDALSRGSKAALGTPVERATYVRTLPRADAGIGASRNYAVRLAAEAGLHSMILADDDIKPSRAGGRMASLIKAAQHERAVGITARYSYHDLCLGPDFARKGKYTKVILLPTGTFRLVGLNVKNVLELGNYDSDLEYAEDCDLFLRSLKAGIPWMIHAGTWSNSIGNRYEPGGMVDFATGKADTVDDRKPYWHDDLNAKWPKYTNQHDDVKCAGKQNCIRVSWRKAYDELIPEWREYSELHGGHIKEFLYA